MSGASGVMIREYMPSDEAEWIRLRTALWPESDAADALEWSLRTNAVTLVAERSEGSRLAGFAEVGTRVYADGCDTSPVAFLEGWYVEPALRGLGIGAGLVRAAILWAKGCGLTELASDSLLENREAYAAHLAAGFEEVERSIKYRLRLD